jgi:hypothetical protein
VAYLLAVATTAVAQPAGHGFHPPMPDQRLYFQCRPETGDGSDAPAVEVPVQLRSEAVSAGQEQLVELPAPFKPVRLKRYLPQAVLEQSILTDESGQSQPAIQLAIEGPTQSFKRWLLAGDNERNRLISFIGTWRYMAVAGKPQRDELFVQFRDELTAPARLMVSRPDGSDPREMPAETGLTRSFEDLGCTIRVREWYPHYALENKSGRPVNVSDKRINPAVLVEIERAGFKREQQWVFARFPDFKPSESSSAVCRLTLECPLDRQSDTPDFLLVTVARGETQEVWTRQKGKTSSRPVKSEDRVEITGSPYTFRMAGFSPSAQLMEAYRPAPGKGTVAALEIEYLDSDGKPATIWLESGKPRVITAQQGTLVVSFGPRTEKPPQAAHGQVSTAP